MKPEPTMGAFERLPPELIPRILPPLYFFDRPSLFHLALVSKKFYHICLYTYLERIHITNPQEAINVDLLHQIMRKDGRVYDALTVLRLPFLFHETNSLTCTFPEAMWLPYNGEFIFHIKRLHAVVSRFTQIKCFVLNCYSEGCHPLNGGRGYLEQWMAAMGLLLNTVLEKGCESMEINGLRWASGVYNAVRRPTISKPPPISNVLKNKTWHFSRHSAHLPKTLVHLSDEAQRSTKLQKLTIGSTSLAFPPLLQWTFSVLRYSPIDTVEIMCLEHHNSPDARKAWQILMDFLPRALPRLQHLDVRAPDPEHAKSFEDINAMAASFPDLKHFGVYVTRLMEPRDPNNPGKPQIVACPILKNLVELHVPAEWVERCFKASRGPGHVLPNLRRLEVTFDKGFEYSHPLDKLTRPCDTLRDIFNDISIKKRALGIPYEVAFNIRGVSPKALSVSFWTAEGIEECIACVSRVRFVVGFHQGPLYPFPMRDLYADPPPGDRTWMRWTKQFRSMKYLHIETVLDSPRCSSYMMRLARAIPPEVEERLEVLTVEGNVVK